MKPAHFFLKSDPCYWFPNNLLQFRNIMHRYMNTLRSIINDTKTKPTQNKNKNQ